LAVKFILLKVCTLGKIIQTLVSQAIVLLHLLLVVEVKHQLVHRKIDRKIANTRNAGRGFLVKIIFASFISRWSRMIVLESTRRFSSI
jgi:hypothetical protein